MKAYHENGDNEQVTYDDGTVVNINVKADTYSVTMPNGEVIARNYTSFVPVSSTVRFACNKDPGEWKYKLPTKWSDHKEISVYRLKSDGSRESISFSVRNGELKFNADANVPYKVIYR